MLTLPLLIMCWVVGFITAALGIYQYVQTRRWLCLVFSYYMVGFWVLAMPLKMALHATSLFGMFYLSTVWPLWIGQGVFGYHMVNHTPLWLIAMMFNFS
jgi:hypothetical protein